jgi:hypothetical protein
MLKREPVQITAIGTSMGYQLRIHGLQATRCGRSLSPEHSRRPLNLAGLKKCLKSSCRAMADFLAGSE